MFCLLHPFIFYQAIKLNQVLTDCTFVAGQRLPLRESSVEPDDASRRPHDADSAATVYSHPQQFQFRQFQTFLFLQVRPVNVKQVQDVGPAGVANVYRQQIYREQLFVVSKTEGQADDDEA